MSTTHLHQNPGRNIDAEIGERVHSLMWKNKVTNKTLGQLLGIDATAVGKKLHAQQKFSIAQLIAIAERLNTTVAYLVGEAENPHQSPDGGSSVGPARIELTPSTVVSGPLAIVTPIRKAS